VIQLYSRVLGLELALVNGMLRLTFSDVHPLAPAARLSFLLHLDDARAYRVYECTPPLAALDDIVAELRATDDVSFFVHRMRRAFRDHLDKQFSA
jgi:hypothetical protein